MEYTSETSQLYSLKIRVKTVQSKVKYTFYIIITFKLKTKKLKNVEFDFQILKQEKSLLKLYSNHYI